MITSYNVDIDACKLGCRGFTADADTRFLQGLRKRCLMTCAMTPNKACPWGQLRRSFSLPGTKPLLIPKNSLIQVSRLCRAVATASSKSAAQSVAQRAHEIILTTHRKYFEGTTTLPGLTPLRGPASHKARFHVVAARFNLAQACLSASGLHDQLILADAIIRAGEMVECFDEAASNILLYVQDTIALMMLGFGEWIGRVRQSTFYRLCTAEWLTPPFDSYFRMSRRRIRRHWSDT